MNCQFCNSSSELEFINRDESEDLIVDSFYCPNCEAGHRAEYTLYSIDELLCESCNMQYEELGGLEEYEIEEDGSEIIISYTCPDSDCGSIFKASYALTHFGE
ncbi:MAG: hypothetical protein ACOCP4_03380 [Candidatus Woesearchaeota archaeon]